MPVESESQTLQNIARLAEEMEIVERIKAELVSENALWARDYLQCVEELFARVEGLRGTPLPKSLLERLSFFLLGAREQLLRSISVARVWLRVARAIQPEQTHVLPRRLIKKLEHKEENTICWDAIEASAWVRGITASEAENGG